MSEFTYVDVLLKAASRVEQEGMWYQGGLWPNETPSSLWAPYIEACSLDETTPACAVGTLAIVAVGLDLSEVDYLRALNQLAVSLDNDEIGDWNDAPGRTAHEVAEAMRKAAQ